MISGMLIGEFIKNIVGFGFGGGRAKYTVGIFFVIGLVAGGMWLMHEYDSVKIENAKLVSANEQFSKANEELYKQVADLQNRIEKQENEYKEAVIRRGTLEERINTITQERANDQQVFEKECGRFERLMQKKGKLVVRAANRATKRVFKRIEDSTATTTDN